MKAIIYICPQCFNVFKVGKWERLTLTDLDTLKGKTLHWKLVEVICPTCNKRRK